MPPAEVTPLASWLTEIWRRWAGKRLVISVNAVDTQERWPTTLADLQRMQAYETYLNLFLGRHQPVFEPRRRPDEGPYVTTNILGAISRLTVHRLFGEAPRPRAKARSESLVPSAEYTTDGADVSAQPGTRNPEQALLDFLCQSNAWQQLCYQGALGGSYRGDTVFKVRYEAARDAVIIEEVPPSCFFPERSEEQQEEIVAVSLARGLTPPSGHPSPNGRGEGGEADVAWLVEEYHTPGLIENRLWKLIAVPGEARYLRQPVELAALAATAELEPVVQTGLDVIPIVHIPNRKIAETGIWGQSDYVDLLSLQEALNRRKTQTGSILDKHADPLLAIDESFLDENRRLQMDRIRAIPLVQDEPPPQYITWDGKLADSRAEADDLLQRILLVAGISPESFGLGRGSSAESGRAIALRQVMTTSTVAGKRLMWEPGLRKLLSIATRMYLAHVRDRLARARALRPEEIAIEFGDGLPRDFSEAIRDEVALQGAGLASKETSLRRLFPAWGEADVEAELKGLTS